MYRNTISNNFNIHFIEGLNIILECLSLVFLKVTSVLNIKNQDKIANKLYNSSFVILV